RNAHDHREPAGRTAVGGSGVAGCAAGGSAGTRRSGLGEGQFAGSGVVIKNLGVASPLDGGLELAARLSLAEMLVDEVAEKFVGKRAVRLRFQRLLHLAQQRDISQGGLAEDGFASLNVRASKFLALVSDDGVAFLEAQYSEQNGGVFGGKKRVDFEAQLIREAMKIDA